MTICTELKYIRHETAHHYTQVAYATCRNVCNNKSDVNSVVFLKQYAQWRVFMVVFAFFSFAF